MLKKLLCLSLFAFNFVFADRNNYSVNVYELTTSGSEEIFSIIKGWKIDKSEDALLNFLDGKFLIDKSDDVLTQEKVKQYQKDQKIRFVTCLTQPQTKGAKYYGFTFINGMELSCDAKQYPVYAYASNTFIQNQSDDSKNFLEGFPNLAPRWTSGVNYVFFQFSNKGVIDSISTYDYDYLQNSIGGGGPT